MTRSFLGCRVKIKDLQRRGRLDSTSSTTENLIIYNDVFFWEQHIRKRCCSSTLTKRKKWTHKHTTGEHMLATWWWASQKNMLTKCCSSIVVKALHTLRRAKRGFFPFKRNLLFFCRCRPIQGAHTGDTLLPLLLLCLFHSPGSWLSFLKSSSACITPHRARLSLFKWCNAFGRQKPWIFI